MIHNEVIQNRISELIGELELETADKTFDTIRKLNLLQRELVEEYKKSIPKVIREPGKVNKVDV